MSVESVAPSLLMVVGLGFAAAGIVGLLYLGRRRLIRFFVRTGALLVERFLQENLRTVGIDTPRWVLVPGAEGVKRLGLVVARKGDHVAVFLPLTPQLVSGELVFVSLADVRHVVDLGLSDGIEALSMLGVTSDRDVLACILSQMEE